MNGIPITINRSNSVSVDGSRYVFQVNGGLQLKDMEVSLVRGFIFNSVFNVSDVFANNTFSYNYPNGAGFSTVVVTMQNGSYDVDTITNYMQSVMLANKHYLIDASGNNVYYISLNVNTVFYAVAVTSTPVPSVLPAGWSIPAGSAVTLPPAPTTPQLVIGGYTPSGAASQFGTLIGFAPGSFPPAPQASIYLAIGGEANISPQYAFNVCLNVVNLPFANTVPSTIYPFSFDVPFLGQQILSPVIQKFYPTLDGKYTQIILSILDQDGRPAVLNTRSAQFTIEFRPKLS
jgi:hypothetical protein